MNNVVFIRFSWKSKTYHAWSEREDGTKHTVIDSVESKPWNGSNADYRDRAAYRAGMKRVGRVPASERQFPTDRERVARDQPSKAKAQSMGTKKRGQ